MWADMGLRPVIGTTLDAKVMPQALEDREVDLLSCWRKWNQQTVPNSALNQWLRNVDAEWGPDSVDKLLRACAYRVCSRKASHIPSGYQPSSFSTQEAAICTCVAEWDPTDA